MSTMVTEPKVIGVLGGMGPAATADFYHKLIQATPAKTDQDHLKVLIFSNPHIPDRTAAIRGDGPDPLPDLIAGKPLRLNTKPPLDFHIMLEDLNVVCVCEHKEIATFAIVDLLPDLILESLQHCEAFD